MPKDLGRPMPSRLSGEGDEERRFTMEITMKMKEDCGSGMTRKFATPRVKYYHLSAKKRRLIECTVGEALFSLGLKPLETSPGK